MSEINPNHPVTVETRDHWHKIVAVLMLKLGLKEIEITTQDVARLGNDEYAVVADLRGGRYVVRLIPMAEALDMAQEAGGLPH
jgi:hypothetical protein